MPKLYVLPFFLSSISSIFRPIYLMQSRMVGLVGGGQGGGGRQSIKL